MEKQSFKKFFLIIMVLLAASCSSDDEAEKTSQRELVIKKMIETTYFSGEPMMTATTDFTYENGQLESTKMFVLSGGYLSESTTKYFYEGDNISQTINYANGVENSRLDYVHDDGLMTQIIPDDPAVIKTNLTYANGNLASAVFSYVLNGAQVITIGKTDFVFNSGNLTNKTDDSNGNVVTTNYRFDAKNNPAKFMNRSLRYFFSREGFDLMSQNNVIYSQVQSDAVHPQTENYQIVYNEDDYPVEIKRIDATGVLVSIRKFEYQ